MKSYFFDNVISFQDTELKPGWLKGKHKITNDATAAFIGPYINTQQSPNNKKLFQNTDDSMLHIIVEHKGKGARETATCLELMLVLLCQSLGPDFWSSQHRIYYESAC